MIRVLFDEVFLGILGVNLLLAWGLYVMVATGQLSIGQAGFMAIGAYTASWVDLELGRSLWEGVALGVLASALVAVPVAIGASRMRGVYLAIGTLAVGQIVVISIGATQALGGRRGYGLMSPIGPGPILVAGAAVAALIFCLERSRWGVAARAIRDDEEAASASGVPGRTVKVGAVILGAAVTGLAGGLDAHFVGFINPAQFGVDLSFLIALYVLIGGSGHFVGPAVGAALLTYLPQAFRPLARYDGIVYGLSLILIMIVSPEGLVTRRRVRAVWNRLFRRAGPPAMLSVRSEFGTRTHEPARDRPPVLVVHDARKRFAGMTALDGVDIQVRPGEILGLIGPNGAGKSTLVNVATGLLAPSAGVVVLDGADVTRLRAEARTRRGMARTFQEVRLFPNLTVGETIWLAARFGGGFPLSARPSPGELEECWDRVPSELPYAVLRKVQLAQALASTPVVLFLDEPTSGLDESELLGLRETIAAARAEGTAIVLIDHNLDVVMEVADRVAVLEAGRKIAEGSPGDVRSDPGVQSAYLGRRAAAGGPA